MSGVGRLADRSCQGRHAADIRERVLQLATKSRKTWLGLPARAHRFKDAIGYDESWRIFVNMPRGELRGSAGLGRRKTIKKGS